MDKPKIIYSIIIPVYNEAANVAAVFEAVRNTMLALNRAFEIIFVNDGSTDKTLPVLEKLSPLRIVSFRNNFGQTAALDAGIKHARGEYLITLDGDGQNPPEEIPKLIKSMQEGKFDVVSGWRQKRQDPLLKRFFSRGAYFLRSFIVKDYVHDSGCTLKIYRRECFNDLDLFGEIHRFIPAILHWRGFQIGEVKVSHKPRIHGESKYRSNRAVKGFVDMISVWFWRKFASRPLHLFGGLGILLSGSGFIFFIYLALRRLFFDYSLADKIWPLIAVLLIVVGVQLFVSGIMTDISIKNYYTKGKMPYVIREVIEKE